MHVGTVSTRACFTARPSPVKTCGASAVFHTRKRSAVRPTASSTGYAGTAVLAYPLVVPVLQAFLATTAVATVGAAYISDLADLPEALVVTNMFVSAGILLVEGIWLARRLEAKAALSPIQISVMQGSTELGGKYCSLGTIECGTHGKAVKLGDFITTEFEEEIPKGLLVATIQLFQEGRMETLRVKNGNMAALFMSDIQIEPLLKNTYKIIVVMK